jgi:putative transposase
VAIKHRIDEVYTAYPFYGSRRITAQLVNEGLWLNRKTVQRHMREMGIAGIAPGPNLSQRRKDHTVYPYLLRGVVSSHPNHIWGIDITYIRLQKHWMYLVAVLDWYSRYVVSWQLDQTLDIDFVLVTVDAGVGAQAKPTIWNSDQGSHFTSPQYIERLLAAGVRISMDGKGRALDNIFTERLWRTVKYEEVYLQRAGTQAHASPVGYPTNHRGRVLLIVNLNGDFVTNISSHQKGGWDFIFHPFAVLTNGSTLARQWVDSVESARI